MRYEVIAYGKDGKRLECFKTRIGKRAMLMFFLMKRVEANHKVTMHENGKLTMAYSKGEDPWE